MYETTLLHKQNLPTDWFEEQIYQTDEVITFGQSTGVWAGFANVIAGLPLQVGEHVFQTAEGLYHACSFSLRTDIQELLAEQKNGQKAKKLKNQFQAYRRKDWSEVKFLVMEKCLELKVVQHWTTLQKLLIDSETKQLVEVNQSDRRWGAVQEGNSLVGCNWMGRSWNKVRDEFLNNEIDLAQIDQVNQKILSNFLRGKQ